MKHSLPSLLANRYTRTILLAGAISIAMQTDIVQSDVNKVMQHPSKDLSQNTTLENHLQEVQKHFPDNLNGEEFMEKFSTLEGTIRAYEDIIQELDEPARTEGMNLIEKQNREIELIVSGNNTEEQMRKIYITLREQLAGLLGFVEKNTKKELNQCRKSNITV